MKNYYKIFIILAALFAVYSIVEGLHQVSIEGKDCQIEGARYFIKGINPYDKVLEPYGENNFKYSRLPTLLPQGYIMLLPFTFMPDNPGFVVYGLFAICLTLIVLRKDLFTNPEKLLMLLLIMSSFSYRTNIENGQIGSLLFPCFILFYRAVTNDKYNFMNTLTGAIFLLIIACKPTLYFFIPMVFLINISKKNFIKLLSIVGVYLVLQVAAICFFAMHCHVSPLHAIESYVGVLRLPVHTSQMYDGMSYFNINMVDYNFVNLILLPITLGFGFSKTIEMRFFAWTLLSFLLMYHRNYDLFILFLPFVLSPKKLPKSVLVLLVAIVLVDKLVFLTHASYTVRTALTRITYSTIILAVFVEYASKTKDKFLAQYAQKEGGPNLFPDVFRFVYYKILKMLPEKVA